MAMFVQGMSHRCGFISNTLVLITSLVQLFFFLWFWCLLVVFLVTRKTSYVQYAALSLSTRGLSGTGNIYQSS